MAFSGPNLLEDATLHMEKGEKICLLGRNGAGKTTILRLLNGEVQPDSGTLTRLKGVRVAMLMQEVPQGSASKTVYEVVAGGRQDHYTLLSRYHGVLAELALRPEDRGLQDETDRLQSQMDAAGAWDADKHVNDVITEMGLTPTADFRTLSAGMKRRGLLARALVSDPDILLLDEPTNHLDLESILWLENFLLEYDKTVVFVTHDRSLVRRLATRIVEIDRARLVSYACGYEGYHERRQALLDAEENANRRFDSQLEAEELWIRKGIKARRTRNEGRVRALEQMRAERLKRREKTGNVRLRIQEAEKSGRLVAEVVDAAFSYDNRDIFKDFSLLLTRGDRLGIIGPNGCGKTTLLKVILGELPVKRGSVRLGTRIEVAYFDQLRDLIDENKTLVEIIGEGNDRIFMNGQDLHVISYLKDFLFTPQQANAPAKMLSGGEKNRLLLARMFTRPSNVIVLDEPTNDLDVETMELLEEKLLEYGGTVIVVSHDRDFLNNVVTSILAFEGERAVNEYVGGYDDWLRQRRVMPQNAAQGASSPKPGRTKTRPRKLSNRERLELQHLPETIEQLEDEKDQLTLKLGDPSFYKNNAADAGGIQDRIDQIDQDLAQAYVRWEELEGIEGSNN